MKTRLIALLLLLAMFIFLYASEDPSETADYFQKKQELDQLAQRFKAETGFKGEIESYPEQMRLARFTGNFDDLDMTNVRDSVAFRQVCTNIINKLLPYIETKNEQLVPGRINVDSDQLGTRYYQIVNGYKVESGGYLNIYYLYDQKRFGILNVTADIPPHPLGKIISEEEAFKIVRTEFEKTDFCNTHTPPWRSRKSIIYRNRVINGIPEPYRLYWKIAFPGLIYYVDAITSEFYSEQYVINKNYTYSILGKVYDNNTNFSYMGEYPMAGMEVANESYADFTNNEGIVQFPIPPASSYQVTLANERIGIRTHECPNILSVSSCTQTDSTSYQTMLADTINVPITDTTYVNSLYAANIYYHIMEQDTLFCTFIPDMSETSYPNVVNDFNEANFDLGAFNPQTYEIQLRNGLNSHVAKHEASHFFAYKLMNFHQFYESLNPINADYHQAMDEAFAEYWLSLGINSTFHNHGQPVDISTLDVSDIYSNYNLNSLPLDEEFYSWYYNRYPISSAWWSLRDNSTFGTDPRPGVKAIDDLLVETLTEDVDSSYPLRYKPRYFYNLLMQRTADPLQPNQLSAKQQAIADAYNSRGLKFYPKVESYSSGNKGRNIYNLNDPVHVAISDCPQNTRIDIYVIKHDEYTYIDGAPVTSLSDYLASGFTPITTATTDPDGKWDGFLWTASEVGNYDIIVNVGDPDNQGNPNSYIHYAFSGANIMDGFDGRTEPGFKVTDNGIDIVMAIGTKSPAQSVSPKH